MSRSATPWHYRDVRTPVLDVFRPAVWASARLFFRIRFEGTVHRREGTLTLGASNLTGQVRRRYPVLLLAGSWDQEFGTTNADDSRYRPSQGRDAVTTILLSDDEAIDLGAARWSQCW